MKKIVLIGGGGHCKSVLDCILFNKEYDDVVIVDSSLPKNSEVMGITVVGDDSKLPELKKSGFDYAFITVGSIKTTSVRRNLYNLASSLGFVFPVLYDRSSIISSFSSIGAGSFIGKNTVINANVRIAEHCIINTGAIVEHDCVVGDFSHVSVGSILCGNCQVGQDSFIGAGSTVIQGLTIGNNVIISAGSTVIGNVNDNLSVSGLVK